MKKILIFLLVVIFVVSLVGCEGSSTNKELEDLESSNIESDEMSLDDKTYDKGEIEYFSVLESTNNNGLRYNLTLKEFIENYNQLVIEYANTYSVVDESFIVGADFKRENNSQPDANGVVCDMYICKSTLLGYNDNLAICISVEKDSHHIANVSVAIDSNMQDSFSDEQRFLYTVQNHIVYRALINELTSEDCYSITDGIKENSERFNVPAHFEKGVAFCLDFSYEQSIGIRYSRITPCTKEQWKAAPGFKDISID